MTLYVLILQNSAEFLGIGGYVPNTHTSLLSKWSLNVPQPVFCYFDYFLFADVTKKDTFKLGSSFVGQIFIQNILIQDIRIYQGYNVTVGPA